MRTRKAGFDCMVWMGVKKPAENSPMDAKLSWRALIAEYLGTLLLVFMGTIGSVHKDPNFANFGPFAGGFAVGTIVKAIAHVSGGHINPAVSIGFFACHRMTLVKTILYILAQCAGAISGSAILKAILPDDVLDVSSLGVTQILFLSPGQAMVVETIITFILVFMIVSTTDGGRNDVSGSVPLAIGIYIVGAAFAAGPLTGASMNPARSLGPAVISGHWDNHWVYWAGPICGGALAALIYHNLFDARFVLKLDEEEEEAPQPVTYHHSHNPRGYIEDRFSSPRRHSPPSSAQPAVGRVYDEKARKY